jgi:hypothetical protein
MAEPVEIPLIVDDKASKPLVAVGDAMKGVGDAADALNKKLDAFDKKTADLNLGTSISAASEFKAALGGVAEAIFSVETAAAVGAAAVAALAAVFAALVVGATAIAAGIGFAVASAISFGDALADLQVTTGKTAAELQRLQFEGEQSGLGFEKLLAASKKLEAGVASGSTKVADGLKKIGVSAAEAAGAGGIDKVVQALAKIEDPSKRATAAVELFGSKLGITMAHAADELTAVGDRFTQLGVVVDESIVKAGDQTADAFKTIGIEIKDMVVTFGGAILQSGAFQTALVLIQDALAGLFRWLNDNKAAITDFTDTVVVLGAQGLTVLAQGAGVVVDALAFLARGFVEAGSGAAAFQAITTAAFEALAHPTQAFDIAGKLKQELQGIAAATEDALGKIKAGQDAANEAVKRVVVGMEGFTKAVTLGASANRVLADSTKPAAAGLESIGTSAKKAADDLKKFVADEAKAIQQQDQLLAKQRAVRESSQIKFESALTGGASDANLKSAELQGQIIDALGKDIGATVEEVNASLAHFADTIPTEQVDNLVNEFEKLVKAGADVPQGLGLISDKLNAIAFDKATNDMAAAEAQAIDLIKTLAGFGVIPGLTPEFFDAALGRIPENFDKATKSSFDFDKALAAANDAMQILGISGDSFLGTLIGGLQVAAKSGHDLGEALKGAGAGIGEGKFDIKKLDVGATIGAIAGVIGAFKKATDSASGFKRAIGGALVGAKFGGQVGAIFGPVGAAIGAVAGGIIGGAIGFFKKPGWVKAGEQAGKVLGFSVSKELAKTIEATAKSLKIDIKSATLLNLDKAILESGKHAREFGGQIGDLMKGIASGAVPAAQGIEQLDSAFQAVRVDAEKAAIVGDKVTRSIIAQAKASGQLTDSMKAFLEQQSQLAATGASGLADAFKTLGFATEEQGKAAAGNFIAAFNVALEQDGLVKATDAFRDSFATMRDDISKAFGEDFANTALAPIAGLFDLTAEGSPFRGAAQLGDALNQIFTAVANSGQLTADSMTNFGVSAKQAFDAATAGGATVNQALQAQLPFLQSAVSASEQYGLALDANTQGLVDQAKAAGFAFPTDPLVKVVDLLTSIAVKMGAIPAAAATAASGMAALPAAAGAAATQVSASVSAISEEFSGKLPRAVADGADAAAGTVQELGNTMENDLVSAAVSAANGVESALNSIRANTVVVPVVFDQQGGVPEGVTVPGGAEPTTTAPRRRGGRGGGEGFAEGGFIPAVPGGRLIRVAEGGQGEFVIPADKMGSQASVTFNMNVNGSGLSREELTRAMIEAYQTAERGLLRQHQQASRGRR